jgi:hypothetical protein
MENNQLSKKHIRHFEQAITLVYDQCESLMKMLSQLAKIDPNEGIKIGTLGVTVYYDQNEKLLWIKSNPHPLLKISLWEGDRLPDLLQRFQNQVKSLTSPVKICNRDKIKCYSIQLNLQEGKEDFFRNAQIYTFTGETLEEVLAELEKEIEEYLKIEIENSPPVLQLVD